ncbi:MAG: hypothetical protein LBT65_04375 [Synergistaceae bacterium]|nr:hypothetical protein [Synergistaceae bacterium]
MEKIYVSTISADVSSQNKGPSGNFGSRRILHQLERRYLSPEAQELAYCLLSSATVPSEVTENAMQQAVALGSVSDLIIDAQTFQALLEAVTLNPSFRIPFSVTTSLTPSSPWLC